MSCDVSDSATDILKTKYQPEWIWPEFGPKCATFDCKFPNLEGAYFFRNPMSGINGPGPPCLPLHHPRGAYSTSHLSIHTTLVENPMVLACEWALKPLISDVSDVPDKQIQIVHAGSKFDFGNKSAPAHTYTTGV
jgi:hypothetical protein